MRQHKFTVRSSSSPDERYEVSVDESDAGTIVRCTCPAGVRSQLCKHKMAIVNGDISSLLGESQQADVIAVAERLSKTSLCAALRQIDEAEKAVAVAQKQVKAAKEEVGHLMIHGIPNGC